MIKYASLFSGIGGFELGIQAASELTEIKTKCVFASEFDPESKAKDINEQPARIIYNKNFGEYPHGDITKINASDVPDHDLIVGGPPCQDFSIAGKRAGLCGTKGSMFNEFIRIAREKQPRYLLIENVKGILSSNRGGHHSSMTLLCGSAQGFGKKARDDKNTVPTLRANTGVASNNVIIHGNNFDRISNDTVPTLCNHLGTGGNNVPIVHSTLPRSSKSGKGGIGHLSKTDGSTYCLDAANNLAIEMYGKVRRLTPIEVELLQGFPRDWTAGVADTNRYRCIGNSVTVPVVADIAEKILRAMV